MIRRNIVQSLEVNATTADSGSSAAIPANEIPKVEGATTAIPMNVANTTIPEAIQAKRIRSWFNFFMSLYSLKLIR
jgi:hypothetical protein